MDNYVLLTNEFMYQFKLKEVNWEMVFIPYMITIQSQFNVRNKYSSAKKY